MSSAGGKEDIPGDDCINVVGGEILVRTPSQSSR